ncbi:MAG TPA: c-type cytochrome [Candidatus Binatia bacterium]|nr:c-type cytochrome [Candidatus Binatia bacterium]
MDADKHDKVFIAQFGLVIGALGAFTVAIIVIANLLDTSDLGDEGARARLVERIQPPAQVITDPQALLKLTAASTAARAPMSGDEVVSKVCGACHGAGVLGAPKIGDAGAWKARSGAAGGVGGLVKSAIHGKGQMPPRGGDASLSDAEIKDAIEAMLKKSGA